MADPRYAQLTDAATGTNVPAAASPDARYVAQIVAASSLHLSRKLDELVQIAYQATGLTPNQSPSRTGWSSDV